LNPKVIGFSGSPVPKSNTDRAVKGILEASTLDYEFIKLSDFTIQPCRACKRCVNDNICKITDDFPEIAEKIKNAEAIVIGAYCPYGSIDAWTKALMERFWSLRHNTNLLKGKFGVVVVTGLREKIRRQVMDNIENELKMERMEIMGNVLIPGNVPCLTCGSGDSCEMSGVPGFFGKNTQASADLYVNVEDQKEIWGEIIVLGKKIHDKICQNK
jgi:multimeric flavodoxin WrbA